MKEKRKWEELHSLLYGDQINLFSMRTERRSCPKVDKEIFVIVVVVDDDDDNKYEINKIKL